MLRVLKSELLTEEKLKDIMEISVLEEALNSLRETPYASVAEAHDLDEALRIAFSVYAERIRKIAKFSPKELKNYVLAFIREDMLRDIMSVIAASILKSPIEPKSLVTYVLEDSPLRLIEQDPESLKNPQRLTEILSSDTWLRPYLEKVLEVVQKGKDIKALNFLSSSFVIDIYSDIMRTTKLNINEINEAKKVLCPKLYITSLSAVLEASISNISPKTLREVSPRSDICKAWTKVVSIYEREQEFEALTNSLKRELRDIAIEGETFNIILINARLNALKKVKKESLASYTGYPFSIKLLTGALTLLRLEYDTLKVILSAIDLGLKPEEYEERIIASYS